MNITHQYSRWCWVLVLVQQCHYECRDCRIDVEDVDSEAAAMDGEHRHLSRLEAIVVHSFHELLHQLYVPDPPRRQLVLLVVGTHIQYRFLQGQICTWWKF